MKKRMIVLAAAMLMGSLNVTAAENTENVVDTAYGKVQGINHTDGYEDIVEFRGIPYAAPAGRRASLESAGRSGSMG